MSRSTNELIAEIAVELDAVADARVFEAQGEAWTYGWCLADYRRNPEAAIGVQQGRVRLPLPAVEAYEGVMLRLLATVPLSQRWEAEELWGIVAEMVATLPERTDTLDPRELLRQRLKRLLSTSASLVAFALANVGWDSEPRVLADSVLGLADPRFLRALEKAARGRPALEVADLPRWLKLLWEQPAPGSGAVVFAAWVPADGQRAIDAAGQRFEDILSASLLLAQDPSAPSLAPLRGDSHKPGVRGLVLHRPALRGVESIASELGAEISIASSIGRRSSVHWYGEDPLPLDRLVEQSVNAHTLSSIVAGETALDRRLRTAARWLGKAHWALRAEDAALALGVALDALLAEAGSSPGRVLNERFAFLDPDPARRASRAERMELLYRVRSSVAHGGRSKEVDQEGFIAGMAADVRWVAHRLLDLSGAAPFRSEQDHAALFASLKWGTRSAS